MYMLISPVRNGRKGLCCVEVDGWAWVKGPCCSSCKVEKSDLCCLFLFVSLILGGSLAKVAYMSEVRTIRKRHYSFTSLTSLTKSEDEDQEKAVWFIEFPYFCR